MPTNSHSVPLNFLTDNSLEELEIAIYGVSPINSKSKNCIRVSTLAGPTCSHVLLISFLITKYESEPFTEYAI